MIPRKQSLRVIALVALALLFGLRPLRGEARSVRVGVFPAAPLVIDKGSKPSGLFIDLVEYFSRQSGWKLEYVPGTWAESLSRLERGEIDLLPAVSYTPARALTLTYSKNAVFVDSGVLFASPKFALHTIFDLQDRKVAALRGSVFTTAFMDSIATFGVRCNLAYEASNEELMRAIVRGEADAGVCIYSLGTELARQYPVVITPISFSPLALEYAVLKGRNAELIETVDRLMAPMIADPDSFYSQAYRRWTQPRGPASIPPWLLWGLFGLLALGLLLGAATLILRRQVRQKTRHLETEISEHKKAEERATQSLREKETLLRELYHRTKNTMQIVRSILALQAIKYPANTELQGVAQNTDHSIQSISLVHEMLYKSRDLSRISVKDYIEELARLILTGFGGQDGRVSLSTAIEDGYILIDTAIPFGLILNELMTNAIKHAFPDGRKGTVSIALSTGEPGHMTLRYDDDGVGVPDGFDFQGQGSFGLRLIQNVGEWQMQGRVSFRSERGVHCVVEIPTDLYSPRV
jgi:two-component sensor histidine kinase/ABC-type amino acid transport substrate-binding protein